MAHRVGLLITAVTTALAAVLPGVPWYIGTFIGLSVYAFFFLYNMIGRASLVQWGKIAAPDKCEKCAGWGVLKMDGTAFEQDARTLAHVMWARGNRRTCRPCNGRGFYTKRSPVTPGPVTVLPEVGPAPELITPRPDGRYRPPFRAGPPPVNTQPEDPNEGKWSWS
jgi:hypothetical protein